MRIHDALSGAVLALLAIAILITVSFYPTIPGQNIGPAAFPGLIAALLLICSLVLVGRGIRGERMALFTAGAWMKSLPHVVNFLLVLGSLLFYILCSDFLGFIIAGMLILAALFYAFHVRALLILPVALGATLLIHAIFYKLLRVPLPWGLLQGLHW